MTNFIAESAILQEAKILKNESSKAVFKMVMQTADEINQNKRVYPRDVLESAMNNCVDRIKRRAFMGELDHPIPTGSQASDGIRQTTVLLKNTSHLVREYYFEGNKLTGVFETLNTPNGNILLELLKAKATIGTSMRGMAELKRRKDNVNEVQEPLYIICYDMVSQPSHSSALVNFSELRYEHKSLICESKSGVICTPDGNCYLPDFFDKLVEQKIIRFFDTWV